MEPMLLFGYFGVVLGLVGLALSVRDTVLQSRADRELIRVLAERPEYRPLLRELLARGADAGELLVTEHEAIDLRERVSQALAHLPARAGRRIKARLYSPSVRGREFYLLRVLSASIRRLQHQT